METRAPQAFVPVIAPTEQRAKRSAVTTDLPRPKTVEPTQKSAAAAQLSAQQQEQQRREAQARAQAMQAQSEMDVKTHQATGSVVILTSDRESGDVIHQFPNNATLKSRAIARYEALQGTTGIKRTV